MPGRGAETPENRGMCYARAMTKPDKPKRSWFNKLLLIALMLFGSWVGVYMANHHEGQL